MYYADPWDEGPRLESLLDNDLPDHEQPVLAVAPIRKVEHPVPHRPQPIVRVDRPEAKKKEAGENRLH